MENYYSRLESLNEKINNVLSLITGNIYTKFTDEDYFTDKSYGRLKNALQDINNVLTLKLSFKFIESLEDSFGFTKTQIQKEIQKLDSISPNSKGFDVKIEEPIKILAEVKSIIPIKEKRKFHASQKKSLFLDAVKLKYNKKGVDTSDYYKFLVIQDVEVDTDEAIEALLKYQPKKLNEERKNRKEIVEDIIFLKDKFTQQELQKDKVYIIKL